MIIQIEVTQDELKQMIELIEVFLKYESEIEDLELMPFSFNINTMDYLLIKLKSK